MSKKEIGEYKKADAMVSTSVRLEQRHLDFLKANKLESGKLIRDLLDKFISKSEKNSDHESVKRG